jgi:hypothetical protein
MAVKKVIELEANIKGLEDDVKDIREQFAELKQDIESVEKSAKETADNTKKGFKGLKGAVDNVKKGFSGLGLAIKTIGIGLVLEAFNTFKQVLSQNQVVADAFAVAFGAISNIFNDFVNFLINNFDKAVGPVKEFLSSDTFEGVENFFIGLITRVKNLIQGIGGLGKALVKVFKLDFEGAAEEAGEAFKNLGEVITGNAEESEKTRKVLKKVADTVKEVTTNAIDNAKAEVDLANASKLAAAEQEKLRLANLKAAEEQRQIRDDVSKDIEARITANAELGKILEKGIEQEKELAQVQLAAAQAALNNNETNIDLQAEVIRAQAAVLEIEERIGGLRSEQLTNETSLLKEKLDLTNSISQSESDARLRTLEGQLAVEDGILDRLDLERQVAAEQQKIAEEQFENTKKIFGEGTIEFENALKEQTAAQETYSNINEAIKKKEEEAKIAIVSEGLAGLSSLLGESSAAGKAVAVAQSIINTYQGATKALAQGGIFGAISAAGVIATGLANVKKIVATKIPGEKGGGGAAAIAGVGGQVENIEQNVPDFNVVGASPINQIAQSLNNRQPVKAFVVSGDVTTAQQLDRNIINESGI